jgi:hypothetical protein
VSGGLDVQTKGRRALVAWLLVAVSGLGLMALGDQVLLPSGEGSSNGSSVTLGGSETDAQIPQSGRTPIRVMIEQHRSEVALARDGRVPIRVMVAWHQKRTPEPPAPRTRR